MAIVSLDDAKRQLNIDVDDTSQDAELQRYIDAVTAPLERELGRVVEPRTVSEHITIPRAVTSFLLGAVPVLSLTSLAALDGSRTWSVAAGDVHVDAESGRVTSLTGASFTGDLIALYQAGMVPVPANVQLSGLIIIQHLWETQRGRAGAVLGGESPVPAGYAIPNRAAELLGTTLPGIA
ncbi:head-tail connector protein [Streptomyces sp. NPDC014748]|uniref:head-tail connector protein n=1 Tax=Streptomyces sp. NPDC014748 TaxID=3364905 RepID=UPI0037030A05